MIGKWQTTTYRAPGQKKIHIGHTKASQPLGRGERHKAVRIVQDARQRLTAANRLVAGPIVGWDQAVLTAADQCFCRTGPVWTTAQADTIRRVLKQTNAGVCRATTIKLSDDEDVGEGYVNVHRLRGIGKPHVGRRGIDHQGISVLTYIHEATHRYADTEDFGERGYIHGSTFINELRVEYRQNGLRINEALDNADSYAAFIYMISSRRRQGQKRRVRF